MQDERAQDTKVDFGQTADPPEAEEQHLAEAGGEHQDETGPIVGETLEVDV